MNTKSNKVENKICNHDKYISTPEFNNLPAETFTARLKHANLLTKTDFDKKLASFNKQVTSNKTKHLEVQKKLDSLIIKHYNFFLGRIYFRSNDGSQNLFVYQPRVKIVLELKTDRGTEYIIDWKSKGVYNSKFIALHGALLPRVKHFRNEIGIQFNKNPLVIEKKQLRFKNCKCLHRL